MQKTPKGLDYVLMVKGMVQDLLAQDGPKIAQAADMCAEALASGKKVYYNTTGHNELQCIWDRVPYTIGTMSFEQFPFKAVPAHGAMDGIILNLILAATIDRLVKKGIPVETTGDG